jgi:hypothetical protein
LKHAKVPLFGNQTAQTITIRTRTDTTNNYNDNNYNQLLATTATTVDLSHRRKPSKIGLPPFTILLTKTEQHNTLLAIKPQSTATLTTTDHHNHHQGLVATPKDVAEHQTLRTTKTMKKKQKLCTQCHNYKKTT